MLSRARWSSSAAVLLATLLAASPAPAAPKHPICPDLGPALGVGVSHFSQAGDWAEKASSDHGVKWKFIYWYEVPTDDPLDAQASFITGNVALAKSLGAMPVFTFYELLEIGQRHGLTGAEADVVKAALQDPSIMSEYFDRFTFLLKTVAPSPDPVLVQVEPDSWGFMIWAFGVEGNPDPTSVPVKVAGSGNPDVAGFSDDASGFGQALLKLRDQYAPKVRMGWHASNFREGTGGDVVASFYSKMGEWDALVTEHPHVEGDETMWWLPWDETKVATNLGFFSTLTGAAHVPILLWQEQIGTTDFHLFDTDATMRTRFAKAGVGEVMFSMRGTGDPDDFRADEEPDLATVPPAASMAGGTAADMRARLAVYTNDPLVWPKGSICASAIGAGAGGSSGSAAGGGGSGPGPGSGPAGAGGGGANGDTGGGNSGGCGCRAAGSAPDGGGPWIVVLLAAGAALRRRTMRTRRDRDAR